MQMRVSFSELVGVFRRSIFIGSPGILQFRLSLYIHGNMVMMFVSDVEILNSLAWTADMDQVWKENKDGDPGLLWQYFGSQSGVLRFYPGLFI